MAVSPTGITDVTPYYEWTTHWSGVERIEQLPGRAFVYVGPNAAFQVPRRAFATDAAYDDFVAEVQAGIQPVAV